MGLSIAATDVVDFHEDVLVRKFLITNHAPRARMVRLFFHHDFHIAETEVGDTAYLDPKHKAIIHYKGPRWFMMNGRIEGAPAGFDQWAVGKKESDGKEGTWRDAEDGELSGNSIVQGAVDSVGALHLSLSGGASAAAWYWIAAGRSYEEVCQVNAVVLAKSPAELQARTEAYWRLWCGARPYDTGGLDAEIEALFRRSLLTVRTQIDHDGGIVAATDYDITSFARDTYAYVWPRDGSLVAKAMDDAGYTGVTRPYFQFLDRVQTDSGYFMHKYNTDGSLASSWHAWYAGGERQLPIQEDETGLPLWALWSHFERADDLEFIRPLYASMIRPAAEFMARYVDGNGLPVPSYDLWEERRGVHAWTTAATWAGLMAASRFFDAFGDASDAAHMRRSAEQMAETARVAFWDEAEGRYVRTLQPSGDGYTQDPTCDASVCGLFLFGMFEAGDERVAATLRHLRERLWVPTPVGGIARYEGDRYQAVKGTAAVPGNPWFVCTLWLAQWHIAGARSLADLAPARELLQWAASHTLPSGVMAEQVDPYTGAPLSVSPLTWSHATLVQAVMDYVNRVRQFAVCETCGAPLPPAARDVAPAG